MNKEREKILRSPEFATILTTIKEVSDDMSQLGMNNEQLTESLHGMIDAENIDLFRLANEQGKPLSCSKGCSFCCYMIVEVSLSEAALMIKEAKSAGVEIDQEHLKKQVKFKDAEHWSTMPYAQRKCVFLKNGSCSVYKSRPAACRKYFAVTSPDLCNGEKHEGIPDVLSPFDAISTAITFTILHNDLPNVGTMPEMLLKKLNP